MKRALIKRPSTRTLTPWWIRPFFRWCVVYARHKARPEQLRSVWKMLTGKVAWFSVPDLRWAIARLIVHGARDPWRPLAMHISLETQAAVAPIKGGDFQPDIFQAGDGTWHIQTWAGGSAPVAMWPAVLSGHLTARGLNDDLPDATDDDLH